MENQNQVNEVIQENNESRTGNAKQIMKDILSFALTACAIVVLCQVVLALHIVPSSSMEPTIKTNSFAVCWRLPFFFDDPAPEHGDIVSFKSDERGKILIKRVIGLPGDEISFRDGYVYRNGDKIYEPYVAEEGTTYADQTYTVPEGHIFVLGDNRMHSADSRRLDNPYISFHDLYAKMLFAIPLP